MPKSLDAGCSLASYFYNTSIPRCLPQTILGEIREEEDEILPRKDYEVRNILNDIFLKEFYLCSSCALDTAAVLLCCRYFVIKGSRLFFCCCRVWTMIDASMSPMWRSLRRWKTR